MSLIWYKDYTTELRLKCFDFFYWFSRFEFALKECGYFKEGRYGEAWPDWARFIEERANEYGMTQEAHELLEAPPRRQVVVRGYCDWDNLNLDRERTQLGKIVLILKTIRNNLFHGGKHREADWDNPERNLFLLTRGKAVLDSLAELGRLEEDYKSEY